MTIFIGVAAVVLLTVYLALIVYSRSAASRRFHVDKQPDTPKSFGYKMAWIAVRTGDSEGLCKLIGLDTGMSANWNSGIGTVYDDALGSSYVFVTPPVDGWTFIVGLGLPHPVGPTFIDKLSPLLMLLSKHFSDVQYYFTYPLIDFFAWVRVREGKTVRAFAVNDEGVVWNNGRVTKVERALGLRLFELRGVRERVGDAGGELVLYPTEDHVLQVAKGWGLDPLALESRRSQEGRGYVARVPMAWRAERQRKTAA